jgi:hypothetical protein
MIIIKIMRYAKNTFKVLHYILKRLFLVLCLIALACIFIIAFAIPAGIDILKIRFQEWNCARKYNRAVKRGNKGRNKS